MKYSGLCNLSHLFSLNLHNKVTLTAEFRLHLFFEYWGKLLTRGDLQKSGLKNVKESVFARACNFPTSGHQTWEHLLPRRYSTFVSSRLWPTYWSQRTEARFCYSTAKSCWGRAVAGRNLILLSILEPRFGFKTRVTKMNHQTLHININMYSCSHHLMGWSWSPWSTEW